jgi:hypothetical protein
MGGWESSLIIRTSIMVFSIMWYLQLNQRSNINEGNGGSNVGLVACVHC